MQQTIFCLWFDSQAEAEANIDVSLIRHSKLGSPPRGGEAGQNRGHQAGVCLVGYLGLLAELLAGERADAGLRQQLEP